ncbi:MAG: hypothetical protein ACXVIY_02170 [Mucilaginibacter sp.]
MEHKVTLGIDTPKKEDALKVAQALVDIRNALGDENLFAMRKALKERPGIIEMVKNFFGA